MGVSLKDIPAPGSWIQLEGASAQALSPRRAARAVVMVVVFMGSMYRKKLMATKFTIPNIFSQ